MKTVLRISLLVVILLIFGWTIWFLYEKDQAPPEVFETEQAETRDIIKKSVATGSVVPRNEIFIKPQISGIIQSIHVKPGDIIEEGNLIAKVKVIPNMVSLNNSENRVNRAKISLENSQVDYDRNKSLLSQEVISAAEFQPFELARKQALEEVNAAEDALAIVKDGVSKKAGNSSNTLIKSTVRGMVLDVPVEEGYNVIEANNFNDGTTIASVADMENLIFQGQVDESEVEKLHLGMELIMTIGAIESHEFTATLEYISPKGVQDEGAIKFEIEAAVKIDSSQFIRAGYSANANVVLERKDNVLSIDEGLISFEEDGAYVEIETTEQQFERRKLELGLSDGIYIEVISGLTEEDKIKKPNK
ncbi:MAG TPA: efflux transporter periplasmic adaptor subunit [Flavobacteriales bacterium]|jgi:HlyD family secretion protein|nr:efflux RND transporter periplasmic adaptor subunit [Flavobacteriales bacterium]HAW19638.1 efflux transporter periplasmic adaptor subunit [Flavobacteriales bacterium]